MDSFATLVEFALSNIWMTVCLTVSQATMVKLCRGAGEVIKTVFILRIIIQRFEREKFGLLKEYLAYKYTRQQDFLVGVKKIVEGRNLTKFKNIVKNSVAVDNESLKTFFEFFPGKEEIEPMDINRVHRRLTAERR